MAAAAATFRFYAELNDHLPPARKFRPLRKEFLLPASVKDMIESFGVPHAEVDLVLVNGESSDFSRLIQDGDRVSVYPVFESLDITPALRLRPQPLREPKFVLDVHLGRLAAFLRMLGFDTLYDNQADDSALVRISSEENRVLLTRDRGVLRHSAVTRGYWLRETDSRRQAAEIVGRFDLAGSIQPFCALHGVQPSAAAGSEGAGAGSRAAGRIRIAGAISRVPGMPAGVLGGDAYPADAPLDRAAHRRRLRSQRCRPAWRNRNTSTIRLRRPTTSAARLRSICRGMPNRRTDRGRMPFTSASCPP